MLEDRLDRRHGQLQWLQHVGGARVDIQQIQKEGCDSPQFGQPLGLSSRQPRADHFRHMGLHHIVAEFLVRARPWPRTYRDGRGRQPHAARRQPLAGTAVMAQLPGFGR